MEPRAVLDYAFDTFGEEKALVVMNELVIPRIQDPERRATLLLSLMYFRPNTKTHCCGFKFCFNCKCMGHHDSCAEEFDEDNDLVRCRSCRVLLLKVEGCDQVVCVCGFDMSWTQEQMLHQKRKKKLVPVDIYDLALADYWLVFRYKQSNVNTLIWLQKEVVAVRLLLRPVFAKHFWRFRFNKILSTLRPAWDAKRARYVDETTVSVRGILRPALSSFIWRIRFTRVVSTMNSQLFWKAYYRWHSNELETEAEEMNTIFNIEVYDEE
ncbi:hypothetical protein P3T76_008451 [Phytophthora citrophthora]|uniref:Uncharacterized protein n=1 Tax=Phytophthora citrophthora TaxID=4793 RepID=A0AAD9GKW8_9STRA|nr:hypothetical protein P3T76_008451 [Phytophthora citrophthora]